MWEIDIACVAASPAIIVYPVVFSIFLSLVVSCVGLFLNLFIFSRSAQSAPALCFGSKLPGSGHVHIIVLWASIDKHERKGMTEAHAFILSLCGTWSWCDSYRFILLTYQCLGQVFTTRPDPPGAIDPTQPILCIRVISAVTLWRLTRQTGSMKNCTA